MFRPTVVRTTSGRGAAETAGWSGRGPACGQRRWRLPGEGTSPDPAGSVGGRPERRRQDAPITITAPPDAIPYPR